ncbi:MAG: zinc-dependent metalloprotease [Bacteroidota bacterium]
MFRKLSIGSILMLCLLSLTAQNNEPHPCGTHLGVSNWLRGFQNRMASTARSDELLYLPMQIHIVGTDEGAGYMNVRTVMQSFCNLNKDFLPTNIQFYLANDLNYINNTSWYDHENYFPTGSQMMSTNNVPNAINCYIVESPAGNCGYYAPFDDAIALNKGCTQPDDHTWAHEVGHYLSLPHPFSGLEGEDLDFDEALPAIVAGSFVELVDRSNCQFAGDGFCDTEADYLNFRWSCNTESISNQIQIDPNGTSFQSDGTLYMSYSNASCKSRFSDEQTLAMRANVEEQRPNLITPIADINDFDIDDELETLTVISPLEDELVNTPTVRLEWEAVENATRYIVQVSRIASFPTAVSDFFTTNNTFVDFSDMFADRTYYWRVFPFSEYDTCLGFLDRQRFETGEGVVNATDLLAGEIARILPNPGSPARATTLFIESRASGASNWRVYNVQGQTLLGAEFQAVVGEQNLTLPTQSLPAGVYLVELTLNGRRNVQKLVLN